MRDIETIESDVKNEVCCILLDLSDQGRSWTSIAFDLGVDTHTVRRWLDGQCVPNGVKLEYLREMRRSLDSVQC